MTSAINTEPLNTACQSQRTYMFNVKENKKTAWAETAAGTLLIAARTNRQQVEIKVGVLQELRY